MSTYTALAEGSCVGRRREIEAPRVIGDRILPVDETLGRLSDSRAFQVNKKKNKKSSHETQQLVRKHVALSADRLSLHLSRKHERAKYNGPNDRQLVRGRLVSTGPTRLTDNKNATVNKHFSQSTYLARNCAAWGDRPSQSMRLGYLTGALVTQVATVDHKRRVINAIFHQCPVTAHWVSLCKSDLFLKSSKTPKPCSPSFTL